MSTKALLNDLESLSIADKADRIQSLMERVGFNESGIMYSMQRLVDGEVRPFTPADFDNDALSLEVGDGLECVGPWDYLHGENSITTSGIYLASQAYRIQADDSPVARDEAGRAFQSLKLIFDMGVHAGMTGWMNKPYGFKPSNETSPDQYSDACWGLFSYHTVAPPDHKAEIEKMIVAFADFWRGTDYVLKYFGRVWNTRDDGGYANSTMLLINALAHRFTGDELYLREAEWFRDHQHWMKHSDATHWRERIEKEVQETGQAGIYGNENIAPFATRLLMPGEVLFWESAILCKFVAVAADILNQIQPQLVEGRLPTILEQWWEQGRYGIGEDLLPYYWFAADFRNGTWRPLPTTDAAPREQWAFGSPVMARITEMRWCEPLARMLATSVIAATYAPNIADAAKAEAMRIFNATDEMRLHWVVDTDGTQLAPEIAYYGQCLSSEMPATYLAAYWRGRRDGLW